MFCTKCGAKLSENAKFCIKCGTKVEMKDDAAEKVSSEKAENMTEVLPVSEPVKAPVNEPAISFSEPVQPVPPVIDNVPVNEVTAPKKNKVWLIILLSILVAILIGAIGFGVYYILNQSGSSEFSGVLKKAEMAYEDEEYEKAVEFYIEAVRIDSAEPDAYEGLAKTYIAMEKEDKAYDILEKGYKETDSDKLLKMMQKLKGEPAATEDLTDKESNSSEAEDGKKQEEAASVPNSEKKKINIDIRQVDNSNFPKVTFYASVTDEAGNQIENLDKSDFVVQEIDTDGNVSDATMNEVYKVLKQDSINVNLVLDASGSMDSGNKMQQAKNAANSLISQMELSNGDQAEIISFDNFVYLEQDFTAQSDLLINAVNGIDTNGQTALYDALYAGLFQTYYESGAKCVIGFTDGAENASSYTFDDVVNMAQNTGIPVYIIGIGEEYDAAALQELAQRCSGSYYSANVDNLESVLEDIYMEIYQEQQDYYVFNYTTSNTENKNDFRTIKLETSQTSEFYGTYTKEYVPESDVNGAFSASYMNRDFMLDFSGQREVTESDLAGMSLAELRIARNEIFARHGRQFRDSLLNQWFYSKTWYLNLPDKYAPDTFEALRPYPLSDMERRNADFIKDYENNIMNSQNIFPDAGYTLLSDYDLALSKPVLKNALLQLQNSASTDILNQNIQMIQEAIRREDVQY